MKVGVFVRTRLGHLRNERRSRAGIAAIQKRKFLKLVAFAYRHSPHYRDLIDAHGIDIADCVPTDFPPLTKAEAMANFDRMVTDRRVTEAGVEAFLEASSDSRDRYLGEYVVIQTSGTSGGRGNFVYSPSDWARGTALAMRVWPFTLRRRRMAFFGMTVGHHGGISHATTSRQGLARLRVLTETCDIYDPIEQTMERLNRFQPDTVSGYPSMVIALAQAQLAGMLKISPEYVALGGEPLIVEDLALIDRAFGATIINHYGSSEHLTMGVGRAEYGGIYLFEDEFIFELEEDRTLVTNLFNYTQPLIRYVMDDKLERMEDSRPVYPFMKIKDIAGRPLPTPVFADGNGRDVALDPQIFATFFVPNVVKVQLAQLDKSSCVVRASLSRGLTAAEQQAVLANAERRLAEIFAESGLANVSRRLERVDNFGGKFRTIVIPGMDTSRRVAG